MLSSTVFSNLTVSI